jgi:hypothetical protein
MGLWMQEDAAIMQGPVNEVGDRGPGGHCTLLCQSMGSGALQHSLLAPIVRGALSTVSLVWSV